MSTETKKKVNFADLIKIFNDADLLITELYDFQMIGRGVPRNAQLPNGMPCIIVEMCLVGPYGSSKYSEAQHEVTIPVFFGEKSLDDLDIRPYDGETPDLGYFVMRSQKFAEVTAKPTYIHAKGHMYVQTQFGFKRIPVDNRCMVDAEGYHRFVNADRWHANENQIHSSIPEEMYTSTYPIVPVYSMEHRRWGDLPIDYIQEIEFDEGAFDRAVLPDMYKDTIRGLVTNFFKTECQSFIKGKNKGLVMLLNGPPGSGKTLTAHSIAELTHRPLYSVGAGDLGTKPEHIEHNLKKILDMVEIWNGIVLIDEADVFMSNRTDYNIEYNACVSVFLRLIETFGGILFLTTNRDHQIDPAFDSRIHIRLRYHDLEENGRALVWADAFKRHDMEHILPNSVQSYELNNREIYNIVQLAYIRGGGDGKTVVLDDIERLIKLRKGF